MLKTHQFRTTFWKLRCRKSARRCGAKHISKSKCTKYHMFGPLFGGSDVVSRGRRKGLCTLSKVSKTWGFCSIFNYNYTTLHTNTLHYNYNYTFTTFHYTTLHYTQLHSITLNYTTLYYTTLHWLMIVGLPDPLIRWSADPLIRWSTDPLVHWSDDPLIRWSADPLICWSADPLVRWSADPLIRWSDDPLIRWSDDGWAAGWWSADPMIRWSADPLIGWSADPLIGWSRWSAMIRWSADPLLVPSMSMWRLMGNVLCCRDEMRPRDNPIRKRLRTWVDKWRRMMRRQIFTSVCASRSARKQNLSACRTKPFFRQSRRSHGAASATVTSCLKTKPFPAGKRQSQSDSYALFDGGRRTATWT